MTDWSYTSLFIKSIDKRALIQWVLHTCNEPIIYL